MKKYVLSFVLMLMTSLSWAQEVEKKPELKGEVSQGVNALKLATDLVKYGYEQQSALPLIQALHNRLKRVVKEQMLIPIKKTVKKVMFPLISMKLSLKRKNLRMVMRQ